MKSQILLILLMTLTHLTAVSQTYYCPLFNGKFKEVESNLFSNSDPTNGVIIYSDTTNIVTSITKGSVINTLNSDGSYTVVVRGNGVVVAYKDLSKNLVQKGAHVDKHDHIGIAKKVERLYQIRVAMWEENGERLDPSLCLDCLPKK